MGSYYNTSDAATDNRRLQDQLAAVEAQLAAKETQVDCLQQQNTYLRKRNQALNCQVFDKHVRALGNVAQESLPTRDETKQLKKEVAHLEQQTAALTQQAAKLEEELAVCKQQNGRHIAHTNQLMIENTRLREKHARELGYTIHKDKESVKAAASKKKGKRSVTHQKTRTTMDGFIEHDDQTDDEEAYACSDDSDGEYDELDDDLEMMDIIEDIVHARPQAQKVKPAAQVSNKRSRSNDIDLKESVEETIVFRPRKARKSKAAASASITQQYEQPWGMEE